MYLSVKTGKPENHLSQYYSSYNSSLYRPSVCVCVCVCVCSVECKIQEDDSRVLRGVLGPLTGFSGCSLIKP